jgi:hypothetical protein
MSVVAPIAASSREPAKPRVPKYVRQMLELMARGRPDDPDCAPLSFIEAAKTVGMKPDVARRWLDRSEVRRLLLAERRVFRDALSAGNEGALARVRDKSENGMAVIGAVRTLEQLSEDDTTRTHSGIATSPGFVIVIKDGPSQPSPAPMIDVTPEPNKQTFRR